MTNVLQYTAEAYLSHLPLLLLFSISFIIAFLIPVFAPLPTYNDMGGIFLRTASIFVNLTPLTSAVIVFSALFSLLFLSFAIVAITTMVKHKRTVVKIGHAVMEGLEKHTARVFMVLLLYTAILALMSILEYSFGITQLLGAIVGIALSPFFFYAPMSIVIDEKGMWRAMESSFLFFFKRFDYVLLWLALAIVILSVFDVIFIAVSGSLISRYALLIVDSLFVLPFLVMLQSECYLKRFALLKR